MNTQSLLSYFIRGWWHASLDSTEILHFSTSVFLVCHALKFMARGPCICCWKVSVHWFYNIKFILLNFIFHQNVARVTTMVYHHSSLPHERQGLPKTWNPESLVIRIRNWVNQVSGQFAHYNDQNGTWFTQFPNHHYCSSESFSILCGLSR